LAAPSVSIEPAVDSDRYTLLRPLGSGASGSVYLARDAETGAEVALKKLFRLDPKSVQRFKREFRSLTDLHHPNLVKIFDLQRASDAWFLTMEYVEGAVFEGQFDEASPDVRATREEQLDDSGTLFDSASLAHLLRLFHELASGIYALHRAGLLHRDLKPSNVLVAKEGRVVVLDFGLVRELDHHATQLTQDGTVAGTPAYMAPEQALGETLTEASDWYAFGVMLYESLAGSLPIDERDIGLLLQHKLRADPAPLHHRHLGVPRELTDLCMQLLSRSPERRPLGKQVLEVLAGLRGETVPREPTQTTELSVYPDTATLKQAKTARFVGRSAAVAQLAAALDRARSGHGTVISVRAGSGTGKTALIEHFLSEAEQAGPGAPLVLRSRCYEREAMPFKALDGVLDGLVHHLSKQDDVHVAHMLPSGFAELAQLFPGFQRLRPAQRLLRDHKPHPDATRTRRLAEQSLRELIERVAEHKPVVLWIDDVQWGDLDSAGVLRDWFAESSAAPLLLMLSYRSEELETSACLRALGPALLQRESEDRRGAIELDALGDDDVRELCAQRLPSDAPPELVTRIVAEARGNPFWVLQLLALAQAKLGRGELELDDIGLGELVMRASALLPPAARMLLDVMAVAGRPLLPQLALRAANIGQDGRTLIHSLQTLRLLRSPVVNGERLLEIYHDRVREAVQSSLDPTDRRRLHDRLLRVLEVSGRADADWLHELASGAEEDALALRYGLLAAERADKMLAFERAIELYQRCLKLTAAKQEQAPLWRKLAQVLTHSRRGAEAAEAYLAAAELVQPEEQLQLWQLAASHLLRTGRFEEGERLVQRTLAAHDESLPESELALYAAIGWERTRLALRSKAVTRRSAPVDTAAEPIRKGLMYAMFAVETQFYAPLRAALFQARAMRYGLDAGDPLLVARCLCMTATVSCLAGTPSAALRADEQLARAEGLLQELENQDLRSELYAARTVCAFLLAKMRLVLETSALANRHYETQRTGDERGDYYYLFAVQTARIGALEIFGQYKQADAELRQLLARAESTANVTAMLSATLARTMCEQALDRAHEAQPRLDRERQQLPSQGIGILHVLHLVAVMRVAAHTGQFDWAFVVMDSLWEACLTSPMRHGRMLRVLLHTARARLLLNRFVAEGRKGDPEQVVRTDQRALRSLKHLTVQNLQRHLHARIAYLRGDKAGAIAAIRQTLVEFGELGLQEKVAHEKYALGYLVGGDEGAQLIAAGRAESDALGVVNPLAILRANYPEIVIDYAL
jgi:tRNA A-37 threonylcarbamoyl transferase component Bud32/tetratricopeptide (TPR) repeat protein